MAVKSKYKKAAEEYAGEMWDAIRVGREAGGESAQKDLDGRPEVPTLQYDEVTVENKPVSDYEYNQNLVNSILREPMKPEEEERRAKAAHTIGGIGAFGNAISALSNLAFTGQGAPSQTLPELPDVYGKVKEMQDRNQKDRENYLRYKSAARQQDRSEWAQDQSIRGQQMAAKNNTLKTQHGMYSDDYYKGLNYKAGRGDKQAAENADALKFGQGQENWKKQFDQNAYQFEKNFEENKRRYEDDRAHKEIIERMRLEVKYGKGANGKTMVMIDGVNTPVNIDWAGNPEMMVGLYQYLPEEILKKYRIDDYNAKADPKKKADIMRRAVLEGLSTHTEFANIAMGVIREAGMVRESGGGNTIPGLNPANDDNTMPGIGR